MFGGTFGTYAFYDIVHFMGYKSFGQIDVGNEVLAQTIGILTYLTIKMAVGFIVVAVPVVVADAIFVGAASVVYTVDEMMFVKEYECTENDRFVNTFEFLFQCAQAECIGLSGNGFVDEQSGGSGADARRFQNEGIVFCFHKKRMLIL